MDNSTYQGMSSSKNEHWCTPKEILDLVRQVNPIALDPCSNKHSTVNAKISYSLPDDGTLADWTALCELYGLAFVNHPYKRGITVPNWYRKIVHEAENGCEIITLSAARTDTAWCQKYVFGKAQAVCFVAGRLRFIDGLTGKKAGAGAFFPSMLAYYGPNVEKFKTIFNSLGAIRTP